MFTFMSKYYLLDSFSLSDKTVFHNHVAADKGSMQKIIFIFFFQNNIFSGNSYSCIIRQLQWLSLDFNANITK